MAHLANIVLAAIRSRLNRLALAEKGGGGGGAVGLRTNYL